MKSLITIFFVCFFFASSSGQQTFQTIFNFFQGEANGEILFTQSDGYIVSGIGLKDKYYLFLIKTSFEGDTLWTKDIDLGLTGSSSCVGTSDPQGNFFIAIDSNLYKFDKEGNIIWLSSFANTIHKLIFFDNKVTLITEGIYLYEADAQDGDSLWRSNSFSETDAVVTSLKSDNIGNILMSVSEKNGYSGELMHTKLFYLAINSDSIINIPFDTGVDLIIRGTQIINDEYYSFGHEVINMGNPLPKKYLIKYDLSGNILQFSEIILNYYGFNFYHMVVNPDIEIVLMGNVIETVQSDEKILLYCSSIQGDSLWSTINGLPGDVIGFDIKLVSDGGFAISGSHQLTPYNVPYLLKTNPVGIITNIENSLRVHSGIKVYPNPSSEYLVFQTCEYIGETLTIFSLNGEIIHQRTIDSSSTLLNSTEFSKGIYLYHISNPYKLISGKFSIL